MRTRYALAGLCLLTSAAGAFGQTATARIQGKVVAADGTPIGGAKLYYVRVMRWIRSPGGRSTPAPGERNISSVLVAAADGSFIVPQLPAGDYTLCAEAPGFLNNCAWGSSVRTKLNDAQALELAPIRLSRGATVEIRLEDPAGLIPDQNPMANPLILAVQSGARSVPARQVAKDASGKTYSALVPFDTPLSLWVHSWKVAIAEGAGRTPLDSAGARVPFSVPAGTTPRTFTLHVTRLPGR